MSIVPGHSLKPEVGLNENRIFNRSRQTILFQVGGYRATWKCLKSVANSLAEKKTFSWLVDSECSLVTRRAFIQDLHNKLRTTAAAPLITTNINMHPLRAGNRKCRHRNRTKAKRRPQKNTFRQNSGNHSHVVEFKKIVARKGSQRCHLDSEDLWPFTLWGNTHPVCLRQMRTWPGSVTNYWAGGVTAFFAESKYLQLPFKIFLMFAFKSRRVQFVCGIEYVIVYQDNITA